MFKDPATLREAERVSQAMFQDLETIRGIAKFQSARAKMTKEEKADGIDDIRKQLGHPPRNRGKPESPYEADTTKEADMTKQASAPSPGADACLVMSASNPN